MKVLPLRGGCSVAAAQRTQRARRARFQFAVALAFARLDYAKQNRSPRRSFAPPRKGGQLLAETIKHGGSTSRGASSLEGITYSMSSTGGPIATA
jgi:hypothetical protein